MKKLLEGFTKAWKPLFDLHPTLAALPVYVWGRYYKYECAGDPFENTPYLDGYGFTDLIRNHFIYYEFQMDLLMVIDKEYETPGKFPFGDFSPRRSTVIRVFDFDGRAGNCLVLIKENDVFRLEQVYCDSPE